MSLPFYVGIGQNRTERGRYNWTGLDGRTMASSYVDDTYVYFFSDSDVVTCF